MLQEHSVVASRAERGDAQRISVLELLLIHLHNFLIHLAAKHTRILRRIPQALARLRRMTDAFSSAADQVRERR